MPSCNPLHSPFAAIAKSRMEKGSSPSACLLGLFSFGFFTRCPPLLTLLVLDLTLALALAPSPLVFAQNSSLSSSSPSACPLDYTVLDNLPTFQTQLAVSSSNVTHQCVSVLQGLHLVLAQYARSSGYFLVPADSVDACWEDFGSYLGSLGTAMGVAVVVNVTAQCENTEHLGRGTGGDCEGIQSVDDLRNGTLLPQTALEDISNGCSGPLLETATCASCFESIVTVATTYLKDDSSSSSSLGNVLSCSDIVYLYASGVVNTLGPTDPGNAWCLFTIPLPSAQSSGPSTYVYVAIGAAIALFLASTLALLLYIRHRKRQIAKTKIYVDTTKAMLDFKKSENFMWFPMEEIKRATNNFARANIVGIGGYGNVYRGITPAGLEIAVKRFKNCSPAGDKDFFHEVELVSSVRHRNLVTLQGCCVHSSSTMEGHQRIIVYDYMPNGSLYDQLFTKKAKMDWATRKNIAIGMAKGLAYLHLEAQPTIIHRDIKASNILLDENWNARVADFGLARFTPEGVTHVTTKVAGTHGYVAPEYAIYGQLTEKSDVYSFGVVLLELLSGRKALITALDPKQPLLLSDWAWDLIKRDKLVDILDPLIEDRRRMDEMERFVLVALLCAHSQLVFRPTIEEALKIMENNQPLPSIPDRPISLISEIHEIENAVEGASYEFSAQSYPSHMEY